VVAEVMDGNVDHPLFYRFHLSDQPRTLSFENEEILHRIDDLVRLFGVRGIQIHQPFSWPLSIASHVGRSGMSTIYSASALQLENVPQDYRLALVDFLHQVNVCTFPSQAIRESTERQLGVSLKNARIVLDSVLGGMAYRELYLELRMMPAGDQIPPREVLHEVFAHRHPAQVFAQRSAVSGTPSAAPKYQASPWYPAFLWLKPLIPKAVRNWGRKVLAWLEERPR
jgi:hypothetical protein